MTKRVHISAPLGAADRPKRMELPWMAFGFMVVYAVAFGFFFGPGVGERPITQLAFRMAEDWRDVVARVTWPFS